MFWRRRRSNRLVDDLNGVAGTSRFNQDGEVLNKFLVLGTESRERRSKLLKTRGCLGPVFRELLGWSVINSASINAINTIERFLSNRLMRRLGYMKNTLLLMKEDIMNLVVDIAIDNGFGGS